MTTTTFSLFSKLPAELRIAIWEAALPAVRVPTLVSYRPGLLGYQDPRCDPELGYRRDFLNVYISVPVIGHVNREARSIVLSWAKSHDLKPECRLDRNRRPCFVGFSRPCERSIDALYLGPGEIEGLIYEVDSRLGEQGAFEWQGPSPVENIAIDEKMDTDPDNEVILRRLMYECVLKPLRVRGLFLIAGDEEPDSRSTEENEKVIFRHQSKFVPATDDVVAYRAPLTRFGRLASST